MEKQSPFAEYLSRRSSHDLIRMFGKEMAFACLSEQGRLVLFHTGEFDHGTNYYKVIDEPTLIRNEEKFYNETSDKSLTVMPCFFLGEMAYVNDPKLIADHTDTLALESNTMSDRIMNRKVDDNIFELIQNYGQKVIDMIESSSCGLITRENCQDIGKLRNDILAAAVLEAKSLELDDAVLEDQCVAILENPLWEARDDILRNLGYRNKEIEILDDTCL